MRSPRALALGAALAAWALVSPLAAQEDPAKDARLAYLDGKFREGDGIIERAPPEVQNNPALRLALAEMAAKFARGKEGEEQRGALFSARQHFAKAVELKPDEPRAATGLLAVAHDLAELDKAARHPDDAKAQAKFALAAAEKALAAGVATPEFKAALGRMYGFRASFAKSMKDVEQLVSDSVKSSTLLTEAAAAGGEGAGKMLSEASAVRLNEANLIHEGIPVETEKRDDEAMTIAIDLATQACKLATASENDYTTHLNALRLAHSWGQKLAQRPFMQALTPPLEGLKLMIPRAPGWTRAKPSPDWDLVLERNLHETKNDGTMQVLLKKWGANDMTLGKQWKEFADVASRRRDKYKEDLAEVSSIVDPVQLGSGKNLSDVWHYEVAGKLKSGRIERIGEWIFFGDKKKDTVWQLKIIDWRPVPDIEEPDVAAFVASAIGEGLWPAGATPPAPEPDPKGPKKKGK